ncbi:hypothetical protein C8R48DRAFT_717701 [Suillus tomentosus]|nr:hypothetical protein C8R48DRAFT_717701 [Suillus tomentosus]
MNQQSEGVWLGVEEVGNPFVQAFSRLVPFVIFTACCCVDQALRSATGAISIFLDARITSLVVAHIRQGAAPPPHFARPIQSVSELGVINSSSMFVGYEAVPVFRWTYLFSKEVPVHIEQLTGLMGVTTILPLEVFIVAWMRMTTHLKYHLSALLHTYRIG